MKRGFGLTIGKVSVSYGFVLFFCALIYLDTDNILPLMILSALAHEMGHYVPVRLFGGRIASIRLTAAGAEMRMTGRSKMTYFQELVCVLSGGLVSLVLGFAASVCSGILNWQTGFVFAGINLAFGLFNLLPVAPLDGGRALGLICEYLWGAEAADRVVFVVSLVFSFTAAVLGLILLIYYQGGASLLFAAVWLLAANITKAESNSVSFIKQ